MRCHGSKTILNYLLHSIVNLPLLAIALFFILLTFVGCWSSPARTVTPIGSTVSCIDRPQFSVFVQECPITVDSLKTETCTIFREELIDALNSTGVFYPASGQLSANVEYEIKLLDFPRRSPFRFGGLGHFPPTYLLSAVFPLWETIEYGFKLQIRNRRTDAQGVIDSREKGTTVFWILAPILNIFPERIWERRDTDETQDLRNRILNIICAKDS